MGLCCLTAGPTGLSMEQPAALSPDTGCSQAGHSWLLPSLPHVPDPVSLPLACTGSLGLRTTELLGRVRSETGSVYGLIIATFYQ